MTGVARSFQVFKTRPSGLSGVDTRRNGARSGWSPRCNQDQTTEHGRPAETKQKEIREFPFLCKTHRCICNGSRPKIRGCLFPPAHNSSESCIYTNYTNPVRGDSDMVNAIH